VKNRKQVLPADLRELPQSLQLLVREHRSDHRILQAVEQFGEATRRAQAGETAN
jgi:hypothetical protein